MVSSEWRTDTQALAADGQYWRSVYGGSRLVLGCIRLTPAFFAAFRLLLMVGSIVVLFMEVDRLPNGMDSWFFLYFHHWTMLLSVLYFVLATILTITAVCTAAPGIAPTTPFIVRVTELCYGMLYGLGATCRTKSLRIWSTARSHSRST